jgi:hypothetical protein
VLRFQTSLNALPELKTIAVLTAAQLTTKYTKEMIRNNPRSRWTADDERLAVGDRKEGGKTPPRDL